MICELCECEEVYDFHHFIPKTLHSNKWFKKNFTKEELRQGINVCKKCHRVMHDLIPKEKQMGKLYGSKAKLLAHPQIAKYISWRKSKNGR